MTTSEMEQRIRFLQNEYRDADPGGLGGPILILANVVSELVKREIARELEGKP